MKTKTLETVFKVIALTFIFTMCVLILIHAINHPEQITFGGF